MQINVLGVDLKGSMTPIYVAARELGTPVGQALTGEVKVLPQQAICTATASNQMVSVVVPNLYTQSYGSYPFDRQVTPTATSRYPGVSLTGTAPNTYFNALIHGTFVAPSVVIGGLALRAWRPFLGFEGTVTATVWLYSRSEVQGFTAAPAFPNPPQGSTLVASNAQLQVRTPTWSAQSWDNWPVIIPFNVAPYTYVRSIQGSNYNLGIWMQITSPPPPGGGPVEVDAVRDGPPPAPTAWDHFSMSYGSGPGIAGDLFVFGLLTGQQEALTPILRAYGEPSLGHELLFQVLQAPPGNVVLFSGGTGSGSVGPGCLWLSDGLGTIDVLGTSSMGDAAKKVLVPVIPSLLFSELYYQAAGGASGDILSNGIRLTFGGAW